MTENKTMDGIHKGLLKKFHTLCSMLGIDAEGKRAIVESYGVESSRDIDTHDLVDLCAKLSERLELTDGELSKQRKRTMAAIGNWLRAMSMKNDADIIKGIACRATGYAEFNKIPKERLRNVAYTFNQKVKDAEQIDKVIAEVFAGNVNLN
ncbi:MAG: hypothetical protein IKZ14_07790 [Muribaculaceae bacterium]|nr:hypothetical protein [Muribaculaceae bacterium]